MRTNRLQIKLNNDIKRASAKCKTLEEQLQEPFEISLDDKMIFHKKQ